MARVTRPGLALSLAAALVVSACATAPTLSNYQPKSPEEAMVVSVLQRIPNGIKAGSADIIALAYADDVFIGNFNKYLGVAGMGAPTSLRGKEEIRAVYAGLLHDTKDLSLEVRNFRLTLTGDRAVAEALLELNLKLPGGRKEMREDWVRNDVVWRMRRTPAGWKIYEEFIN